MNLIKKIEYNYYLKIIDDLIINKKYEDLDNQLKSIFKKSKSLFFQILKKYYSSFRKINNTHNLFVNNIVYVNSFMAKDIEPIINFLSFYFDKLNHDKVIFSDLSQELTNVERLISNNNQLLFEDIIEKSSLYQILLSMEKSDCLNIYKNEFAFFSTSKDYNFSDASFVKCYFLVVDHPYKVYEEIKLDNEQNKFLSQNIMFNLDNLVERKSFQNIEIEILKKGWGTHTSSWTDASVVNSFKGMVIKKQDLINNSKEVFASIILHLRQSEVDLKIDYSIIDEYCASLRLDDYCSKIDISNNEKKFIQKNLKDIPFELEFELWLTINYHNLNKIKSQLNGLKKTDLMIVTKKQSQRDIVELIDHGNKLFGENKVQEMQEKFFFLRDNYKFKVHLIGPLQSNKVKTALKIADAIQSVDRKKLVDQIIKYWSKESLTREFYIQINIGKEIQKNGVMPDEIKSLYRYCITKGLPITGLMCIPPNIDNPSEYFAKMRHIRDSLNKNLKLSMGMSNDYNFAIQNGANIIRIGSLVFD